MDASTKIKVGNLDLISNETILTYQDLPVEINMSVPNDEPITIYLRFEDKKEEDTHHEIEAINRTTAEITFINYNNSLGTYTNELWGLGEFSGRALYLAYIIYGFSDGDIKKIELSFYLGEEIRNG